MKRFNYALRIDGFSTAILSVLILGGLGLLLVLSDPPMRPETIANFLSMAATFITVILMGNVLKPEEPSGWEYQAALPSPHWITVAEKVLLNWLIVNGVAALAIMFAAMGKNQLEPTFLLHSMTAIMVNTCMFSGIALFSAILTRNSKIGQLVALLGFLTGVLNPFRDALTFLALFGISEPSYAWWVGKFLYGLGGLLLIVSGLRLMKNTSYLIEGHQQRRMAYPAPRLRESKAQNTTWNNILASLAAFPTSKMKGSIGYETLLVILDGTIPILILILCVTFGVILPIANYLTHPIGMTHLFNGLAEYPRIFYFFLFPILSIFLVSRIPQDMESKVDQFVFSATSTRKYLISKALGSCTAIFIFFLICEIPVLLILLFSVLNGDAVFLIAHIGILLLSSLPALFYWSILSVLLGTLATPRYSFAAGGSTAVIYIVLFILTQNSVIGNILFPTGSMALETISAWSQHHSGLLFSSIVPVNTVVPFHILLFPYLSIGIQLIIMGVVSLKIMERRFHS